MESALPSLPGSEMPCEFCQQKVIATKTMQMGVPNLGCSKRRNFIQVNLFPNKTQPPWWKQKVPFTKTQGCLAHTEKVPAPVPDWLIVMQMRDSNLKNLIGPQSTFRTSRYGATLIVQ